MKFKMRTSVCPGDTMVFDGTVDKVVTDDTGCCWAEVTVNLTVDANTATACSVRIAIPANGADNPWRRHGKEWKP